MTEIMSFIGERVPSETDNMPSVGATESGAIFEQFPDFVYNLTSFMPLTQETFGCRYEHFGLFDTDN